MVHLCTFTNPALGSWVVEDCVGFDLSCVCPVLCLLQLPKASDTAAMSGAGFMRLVKSVGESISKIAGKKSDSDAVSSCNVHVRVHVILVSFRRHSP